MTPPEVAPPARVVLESRLLCTPKRREARSDDAGSASDADARYALCDGASQSFLAADWAELLARRVVEAGLPPRSDLGAWLAPPRAAWEARRSDTAARSERWYNQTVRPGAATLFALGIEGLGGEPRFTAAMHGDTCGFHVREGRLLGEAMPCRASGDFGMNPPCVASIAATPEPTLRFEEGTARAGDAFFIATDALAKWILVQHEAGQEPWQRLLELETPEAFQAFAEAERDAKRMDEDDVSLLVVRLLPAGEGAAAEPQPPGAPSPGAEGRPAGAAAPHEWRNRLAWSVLVPLAVGVISSAVTTDILVRRHTRGIAASPSAVAPAPSSSPPAPADPEDAAAPPPSAPPSGSASSPPAVPRASVWVRCPTPCKVQRPGDLFSPAPKTPLFADPEGQSPALPDKLGKQGPFKVRTLHRAPAPVDMVEIELP